MKINILSGEGDPRNTKTWSGTPFNIYTSLKKKKYLGEVFSIEENELHKSYISKALTRYYNFITRNNRPDMINFSFKYLRLLNSYIVYKLTKKSESKHSLHCGTLTLPFIRIPKNQSHYLYIDGTWNLWVNSATNISFFSEKNKNTIEQLEYKSFQQVKHIFSIGQHVKENLINHYKISPEKITIVGTGTGVIQPYLGKKDYKNNKILFAAKGRFEDKGGELVLKAFDKALKKNPNLHLSIVGQNHYSDITKHPNISTYGFIPIQELQELFNTHSLFIMPALNEPWGLVYIEALLCKMPIMGLNKNSFPELSGNGKFGVGIEGSNPDNLADSILQLFENIDTMEIMGEKGQEYALNNFSWDLTVEKIINVIYPNKY